MSACPARPFRIGHQHDFHPKANLLTSGNTSYQYLVFGDLHGRVLPAFALARRYQDEFDVQLSGLLQVGDLGYFPDTSRLDSASRRHAAKDPLELGISEFNRGNELASRFFERFDPLLRIYFTAGNHEDHELLQSWRRSREAMWPVDDFQRLWCVDDGSVAELSTGLRVGSLWGIDGDAPKARRIRSPRVQIDKSAAERLCEGQPFDVLLCHESPRDAIWIDSGSVEISRIIEVMQPKAAFFGHYHTPGRLAECDFGTTRVFWMPGMELQHRGIVAEPQSVGILTQAGADCEFQYLPEDWLAGFTRDNWPHWITS